MYEFVVRSEKMYDPKRTMRGCQISNRMQLAHVEAHKEQIEVKASVTKIG